MRASMIDRFVLSHPTTVWVLDWWLDRSFSSPALLNTVSLCTELNLTMQSFIKRCLKIQWLQLKRLGAFFFSISKQSTWSFLEWLAGNPQQTDSFRLVSHYSVGVPSLHSQGDSAWPLFSPEKGHDIHVVQIIFTHPKLSRRPQLAVREAEKCHL